MNELFERQHCRIDSSTFREKWQIESNSNRIKSFYCQFNFIATIQIAYGTQVGHFSIFKQKKMEI